MVQLIELLGNRNAVKILMFFLRKPTMQTYQQNIKKEVKLAKATLIKWLRYLEKGDTVGKLDLILCAIFLGTAVSAKYSSLFLLLLFGLHLILLIVNPKSRRKLLPDLLFG